MARKAESDSIKNALKEIIAARANGKSADAETVSYVVAMGCQLVDVKDWEGSSWEGICKPYLTAFLSDAEVSAVAADFKDRCYKEAQEKVCCGPRPAQGR